MKKYGIIYSAYNKINGKRYVGQTIQLLCERRAGHYNKDKNIYFHRALTKYNKEDWKWQIIDVGYSKEDLDNKEKFWIEFFECRNPEKGYNILEGGSGNKPSLEQIRYSRNRQVEVRSKDITSKKIKRTM